jgi:hypothetical protein
MLLLKSILLLKFGYKLGQLLFVVPFRVVLALCLEHPAVIGVPVLIFAVSIIWGFQVALLHALVSILGVFLVIAGAIMILSGRSDLLFKGVRLLVFYVAMAYLGGEGRGYVIAKACSVWPSATVPNWCSSGLLTTPKP